MSVLNEMCTFPPKKKRAEFRGIRPLLEMQVVAEKAKTSPKSTSNNLSLQGLLSILLVFFLSSPPQHFQEKLQKHQPTPPQFQQTLQFFFPAMFQPSILLRQLKGHNDLLPPPRAWRRPQLARRVMAPILRSGPLLRRGTSAEILRDLKQDARHIGGPICRAFFFL